MKYTSRCCFIMCQRLYTSAVCHLVQNLGPELRSLSQPQVQLIVLTAANPTAFGLLVTAVWYPVTCTDKMEVNSAAPVEVPSAVGYAEAILQS